MGASAGAGGRRFEDVAGRPNLVARVMAWLESWGMAHLVADASGVGQGVTSWLTAVLGPHRVTGYGFAGTGKKAALGSVFLTLIETGRFKYWVGDDGRPLSDGWWFWTQAGACTYDIPPDGHFERDLKWSVPANARVETPAGSPTGSSCTWCRTCALPGDGDRGRGTSLDQEARRAKEGVLRPWPWPAPTA